MKSIVKLLFLGALFGLMACQSEKEEYALEIIHKVEGFKAQNDRLPNDVSEIGLMESIDSPAFYQKETDSTYIVWFGLGLGESEIYHSETRECTRGG